MVNDGKWKTENRKQQMANGQWQMVNSVVNCEWQTLGKGKWQTANGDGHWKTANGEWQMVN
ncbi:hypothetical protein PAXRUDRAFT_51556, partial [Paxillus rubicundulus Ve08.2h10]